MDLSKYPLKVLGVVEAGGLSPLSDAELDEFGAGLFDGVTLEMDENGEVVVAEEEEDPKL